MTVRLPFALLAAIMTCSLTALPAQAQRARVFVASYGTDTGNTICSYTQPCRTFQNAVNNVAAGGEVTAIDSAGFGPISITQSVTITSPSGVEAGVLATTGDGVNINVASSANVVLRGLTIEGAVDDGVVFEGAGGQLEVIGCKIHNFYNSGIAVLPSGPTTVLVKDTIISDSDPRDNFAIGIWLQNFTSTAPITAALDEVTIANISGANGGVYVKGNGAPVEAAIANSHIENNSIGVTTSGSPNGPATVTLQNVTINQTPTAISAAPNTSVVLSHVTQSAGQNFPSTTAVNVGGGTVYSDGTNILMGAISGSLTALTLH